MFGTIETSGVPKEVLGLIFDHLPFSDLANAMLVSLLWKETGEQPFRWRNFKLVIHKKNFGIIKQILVSKRFSQLRNLKWGNKFKRNLQKEKEIINMYKKISQHPTLENLDLSCHNICYIDPEVMKVLPPKLAALSVCGPKITEDTTQALLEAINNKDGFKKLDIGFNNLSKVDRSRYSCIFCK